MPVSPQDFELYSRVTGRPLPRNPQEQMRMAPEVYNFTRNFARGGQIQEKPNVLHQIAGGLGKAALLGLAGGAVYGLSQGKSGETDISPVSEDITSDVGEPKPKGKRNPVYTHTHYGNPAPDPTSDPNFYSEVASHDFGSPTGDGFVEPTVRIPVRREEPAPTTEKYQRTTVLPEGNYGNQVGTVGSLQGGQDEILNKLQRQQEMSAAGDKALDEVEKMMGMGTIPPEVRESLKEEAFGAVDNNDFVNELTKTSFVEQPRDEIVVVDKPQTAITRPQQDPRGFLGDFARGAISKAQEEVDAFDQGINWGQRFDQAAGADSPLKGAAIVAGTIAEKGAKDIATRVGKDLDTTGNIISEAVANVKKIPAAMQEVDSVIANEQMKASVMPDNKMQSTTFLNPPASGTGGVETGLESDLSDSPQLNDTHQENEQATFAGLNRQQGLTTPSTTNLNPDFVRDQANKLQLNIPYADKVKLVLSNLAQAGDQAAKKVVRGGLKMAVGEEKFQEMADANLREQQAERLQNMVRKDARMANVRSKYNMDYNPASPKLPGDAIIGLNNDRFGRSAYIPTGGSDWLRDESLPASAYDVRVPREDEETPLWWEV